MTDGKMTSGDSRHDGQGDAIRRKPLAVTLRETWTSGARGKVGVVALCLAAVSWVLLLVSTIGYSTVYSAEHVPAWIVYTVSYAFTAMLPTTVALSVIAFFCIVPLRSLRTVLPHRR